MVEWLHTRRFPFSVGLLVEGSVAVSDSDDDDEDDESGKPEMLTGCWNFGCMFADEMQSSKLVTLQQGKQTDRRKCVHFELKATCTQGY